MSDGDGDRDDGDLRCRAATEADWPSIWPIVEAVVRRGDTYAYDPDLGEHEAHDLWMRTGVGRSATHVAEVDGTVVATARLQPSQPGLGDHVANGSWMVDPSVTGRGVGRALASFTLDEARRLGYRAMRFDAVVASNTRAISLWTSLGFEIVGTVPRAFRHRELGLVDLHVMHREL